MRDATNTQSVVDAGVDRRRFTVRGIVQGVGFRPFVYVTATDLGLSGSVGNDSSGVTIEVEGDPEAIAEFGRRLRADAPPLAVVDQVCEEPVGVRGQSGFHIAESRRTPGRTLASPDVATCAECLRELTDPTDRRSGHPFVTCVHCGPRYTIVTDLPYDRGTTTMAGFPMCPDCTREYDDPADRRFHAQPIACPKCGPTLEYVDHDGVRLTGAAALARARELLATGRILGVKGLGGYHLACDATSEPAVATLRTRKRRGDKPFAVMARDLETAATLVRLGAPETALLTGPRRPIVLAAAEPGRVASSVAPGNPDLGVLLPYTPLHTLLLAEPGPAVLVMTSGNLGGEPIAFADADARERLASLVDGWLRHDRPIHVPCDDSVTRVVDGVELPIRRSRGYAPLPVALPFDVPPMLAVGGDLKSTCCLAEGRYAWLSPHIGDMDDLATLRTFTAAADHLGRLTGVTPTALVADAHPGYRSTGWAREHAAGRPLWTVQHHHAHVAAVLGEHGHDGRTPVIGFAFDGTGYGTDGAVWGGEVLIADYAGFTRYAHLAYVPLPGGDASVERPYRMALAHLHAAGVPWDETLPAVRACPPDERRVLAHQLETGLGCVPTSSLGRLFDAVSALAGVRQVVDYEAEAAIELEGLARGVPADGAYCFGDDFDAAPVVRAVAADVHNGVSAALIAARFHEGVADAMTTLARRARVDTGLDTVVLAGGVFQNALLLSAASRALRADGFTVLRPTRLPPNDGGLALGQVLVAAHAQREGER